MTTFSADQIPAQCFGGPVPSSGGHSHGNNNNNNNNNNFDDDRTSNALMLFYSKVKPTVPGPDPVVADEDVTVNNAGDPASVDTASSVETAETITTASTVAPISIPTVSGGSRLVDGYQAFQRELQIWNLEHLLSRYMLDPELSTFVRGLLEGVVKSMTGGSSSVSSGEFPWFTSSPNSSVLIPMQATQFGCSFLFDVVLHCRERSASREWVDVLKNLFEVFPAGGIWFLDTLLFDDSNTWFHDYLLTCSDQLARSTFVQVVVQAVNAISPKGEDYSKALVNFMTLSDDEVFLKTEEEAADPNPLKASVSYTLLIALVKKVLEFVHRSRYYTRCADEIFALLRDLASIPCVCSLFIQLNAISLLGFIVHPECVDEETRSLFLDQCRGLRSNTKQDTTLLFQSIFEAIAALMGVPQIRKVALVKEITAYESELVPAARDALTIIFQENSRKGNMDANDIVLFKEKIGTKVTLQQAKMTINRFQKNMDGLLSLEGFPSFYTDLATYNPKDCWKVCYFSVFFFGCCC